MTDGSGVPPGGFTALPEIGTVCAPAPSSELIVYTPVKLPATLGVKVIGIWIASSGARTWPSGSGVATTNGSVGGAALVMVTLRLPVFSTVSVWVADRPTGSCPKLIDAGLIVSCAWPVTALPVSGTDADTDWPGVSTVPVAGSPVTANCPPGG